MKAGDSVVIVGAGQAGAQLALSLRQQKFEGRITLLGDEATAPYQRPPLSKAYMLGKVEAAGLLMRQPAIYEQQRIEWRGGVGVEAIERSAGCVLLAGGERLAYDALVLATGTRNRLLRAPGATLAGVAYLRTLADAQRLRERLATAHEVVVVGGGFIGLEFAAVAAASGKRVTVLEMAPRLMARAVSPAVSAHFERAHQRAGVQVRCRAQLEALEGVDGRVASALLVDGERIAADLVVVGIGVLPNAELAQQAGLELADGIRVDGRLRTSDGAISAIGDCASFPARCVHVAADTQVRLESVQNAVDQAKFVAVRLMGAEGDYQAVSWFWSDQFDQKLQIAGLATGADRWELVEDGKPGLGVHCYAGDRWLAFESVNRAADHLAARRRLAA